MEIRSCIWRDSNLQKVPASRSDVFKDHSLTATDKQGLTSVLKTVVEEMEKWAVTKMKLDSNDAEEAKKVSALFWTLMAWFFILHKQDVCLNVVLMQLGIKGFPIMA